MASEQGGAKKMVVGAHPMSPIGNTAAPFDVDGASEGGAVDVADTELRRIMGALSYEVDRSIVDDIYQRVTALFAVKDAALAAAEGERDAQREACRAIATVNTELRAERDQLREQGDFLNKMLQRFVDQTRLELRGLPNEYHPAWTMPLARADMALHGWAALTGPPEAQAPQEET